MSRTPCNKYINAATNGKDSININIHLLSPKSGQADGESRSGRNPPLAQVSDGARQSCRHNGETAGGQSLMGREIKPKQERGKDQATANPQQPGQAPRQQAQGDQDRHIPPGHHGVRSMLPSSMPATGRLLPTQQADGHTQMALDAWLLRRSNGPALRFYRWDGPSSYNRPSIV